MVGTMVPMIHSSLILLLTNSPGVQRKYSFISCMEERLERRKRIPITQAENTISALPSRFLPSLSSYSLTGPGSSYMDRNSTGDRVDDDDHEQTLNSAKANADQTKIGTNSNHTNSRTITFGDELSPQKGWIPRRSFLLRATTTASILTAWGGGVYPPQVAKAVLSNILASSMAVITDRGDGKDNAPTDKIKINEQQQDFSYDTTIPFSSFRKYKISKLSNGLCVVLVSDQRVVRASAALSIGGAGQFADPPDLPGLAHLMEHMILSYTSQNAGLLKQPRDFEDWLSDNDGASNAFTAYQNVCFHFSCPDTALGEALQRFAGLFVFSDVAQVCRTIDVLRREIRRVNAELDFDDTAIQAYYLTKQFVNLEHPFSRFSAGSLDTLERTPLERGIDLPSRLIQFFQQHYLPREAVLVVVANQDLYTLERFVSPFANTLSPGTIKTATATERMRNKRFYPGAFLEGNRLKQVVLYRKNGDTDDEKLTLQWSLNLDYSDKNPLTVQIAFVLAQIFGRKGPGTLYRYLERRGWVNAGVTGVPRVTVPVAVSGFQVVKLEINLTLEGVLHRSAVVGAVYDTLETLRRGQTFLVSREILTQYANIAKLFGYTLAARPPDAVELAIDAQFFGVGENKVGAGKWYRFAEDRAEIVVLQRTLSSVMSLMSDPNKAVVIVTAGSKAISKSLSGRIDGILPPVGSSKWQVEPIAGGRFVFEDMMKPSLRLEQLVLKNIINRNELVTPVINPLVPLRIRAARVGRVEPSININRNELVVVPISSGGGNPLLLSRRNAVISPRSVTSGSGLVQWRILRPYEGQLGLELPRGPPEPNCRCAFVLELLSARPARADTREAARVEMWKLSFERAVTDLADLGAPGALGYEISFNPYGMRISILGISQTLPSYTRRFIRRLVLHSLDLIQGPEFFPSSLTAAAIANARRAPNLSKQRRRLLISNLRDTSAYEAASAGASFLASCTGAVCFGQGDLLPKEVRSLLDDVRFILEPSFRGGSVSAIPSVQDLSYQARWKPSGICYLPGIALISDACGRVIR